MSRVHVTEMRKQRNGSRKHNNSCPCCGPCCIALFLCGLIVVAIKANGLAVKWYYLIAPSVAALAMQAAALACGLTKMKIAYESECTKLEEATRARELELCSSGMPISVTTLNGHRQYFVVVPNDTVGTLKQLVSRRTEIPCEAQTLSRAQQPPLSDEQTLADAAIPPHAELALTVDVPVAALDDHVVDVQDEDDGPSPPGAATATVRRVTFDGDSDSDAESTQVMGFCQNP